MQKLKLPLVRNSIGSALVFALVFGAALSIMGIGALRLISGGSDMHKRDIEIIKSYWAAEGGLRVAMRYLACVPALPTADIPSFTPTSSPTGGMAANGYTPIVSITLPPGTNKLYSCKCSVSTSSGIKNVITCTNVAASNMARYTWFEKFTSPTVWERMVVYGDFHTNGFIRCSDIMTAEAHVTGKTSTGSRVDPALTWDRVNFPSAHRNGVMIWNDNPTYTPTSGWLETRLPNYSFQSPIDTTSVEPSQFTSAMPGFYQVPTAGYDSVALRLNSANINIYRRNSGGWSLYTTITSNNRVVKCDRPTYVGGTLDGKLTIVTDNVSDLNDIIIGNSITYANNNLTTSDDVLALVSGDNIEIPGWVNNSYTGMTNAFKFNGGTVNASLFMPFGKIWVKDSAGTYENYYTGLYNLDINGGVFLRESGGTFVNTGVGPRGIMGKYYQDPRFVTNAAVAPGIPFARQQDPERTVGASVVYMSALSNGTWENRLSK
jgi:hypothetical protein